MSATVAATFVFTDLVDSTALSASVSASEAEALRVTHFGLLHGVVTATGGTEVKNLGDGLDDGVPVPEPGTGVQVGSSTAIDAAGARPRMLSLAVHVGIAAGEAVEDDGDYFGPPVVEATRLCGPARGRPDSRDRPREAAGQPDAAHPVVALGPLALKGLPDPVETVEVVWEPATSGTADTWPLPEQLVRGRRRKACSASSVEPAGAMADLEEAAKRSVATQRVQLVLVSGEPGLGKTTLAAYPARSPRMRAAPT